jgi:acyl-coenzyme A thioesterase PaaI-like protein
MATIPFQDQFPADFTHCFGCGRDNALGLQIKSTWDGNEAVCHFTPQAHHTAYPGVVNGGILATIIDCHGVGTAAAHAYRQSGRDVGAGADPRMVTASLHVDYRRPTPMGPLELRARVVGETERRTRVDVEVHAGGQICARGHVIAAHLRTRA